MAVTGFPLLLRSLSPALDSNVRCHQRSILRSLSPALDPRSQVELEGPGVAWLLVEIPVVLGDVIRIEDPVLVLLRVPGREVVADERGVDRSVDDDVRDMDVLRAELARHALGERAKRMLGARERAEPCRAAQRRRGAGKQDRPAFARSHAARNRLRRKERREARHLPDLEILARRLVEDAARHVGADVEDVDFDRSDAGLDALDELRNLLFLSRIGREAFGFAAGFPDLANERLELAAVAARNACNVAFARKTTRDGAAGRVSGADDQRGLFLCGHAADISRHASRVKAGADGDRHAPSIASGTAQSGARAPSVHDWNGSGRR